MRVMLEEYSSQATTKWETTHLRKELAENKQIERQRSEEGKKESLFGQRQSRNAQLQSNNVI